MVSYQTYRLLQNVTKPCVQSSKMLRTQGMTAIIIFPEVLSATDILRKGFSKSICCVRKGAIESIRSLLSSKFGKKIFFEHFHLLVFTGFVKIYGGRLSLFDHLQKHSHIKRQRYYAVFSYTDISIDQFIHFFNSGISFL